MKFLSVRDLRGNSARVWRELPGEREMIVTSNGRPVAVLASVDEGSVEQSLAAWRQVRATQAIADIQRESAHKGTDAMSMDDIDAEIKKARHARRNRAPCESCSTQTCWCPGSLRPSAVAARSSGW